MASNTGWPVVLSAPLTSAADASTVVLRPLRRSDAVEWATLRSINRRWLAPWEASAPTPSSSPTDFNGYLKGLTRQAKAGTALPFVIELDGRAVGQLTVSSITRGSVCSAALGYWVSEDVAGRGVVPCAVALAVDHCLFEAGLNRVEVNIRPENERSLRVVAKLGFRDEGVRERYMHIEGAWRDHRTFALTADEVGDGLLARWLTTRGA